jgi:hypothetical protein
MGTDVPERVEAAAVVEDGDGALADLHALDRAGRQARQRRDHVFGHS